MYLIVGESRDAVVGGEDGGTGDSRGAEDTQNGGVTGDGGDGGDDGSAVGGMYTEGIGDTGEMGDSGDTEDAEELETLGMLGNIVNGRETGSTGGDRNTGDTEHIHVFCYKTTQIRNGKFLDRIKVISAEVHQYRPVSQSCL